MNDTLTGQLSGTALNAAVLRAVATENINEIPPDLDDTARFVIQSVRAVARRQEANGITIFVYSEAPVPEGKGKGFSRVMHLQDGHGSVTDAVILTGRDANNGAAKSCASMQLSEMIEELDTLKLDTRLAVVWDAQARVATVYPDGLTHEQVNVRLEIPQSKEELTQDDVCEALNVAYNDNLKNPSGHTVKLWTKGQLIANAELEIERHLKGQIALFFAGRSRPIGVLSQTNTAAGRTDLILFKRGSAGGPQLSGVVELKVLRGPLTADRESTEEGLSQGYHYRKELDMPFSTLALFDVNDPPSNDPSPLLENQNPTYLAEVRVRRFPIYDSPRAWRDASAPAAA